MLHCVFFKHSFSWPNAAHVYHTLLELMEDMKIYFDHMEAMNKLKFVPSDLSLSHGLICYTGVTYEAVHWSGIPLKRTASKGPAGTIISYLSGEMNRERIDTCTGNPDVLDCLYYSSADYG